MQCVHIPLTWVQIVLQKIDVFEQKQVYRYRSYVWYKQSIIIALLWQKLQKLNKTFKIPEIVHLMNKFDFIIYIFILDVLSQLCSLDTVS